MLTLLRFYIGQTGPRRSKAAMEMYRVVLIAVVGSIIFAAGWGAGRSKVGEQAIDRDEHAAGACMALEMAEAHLIMDSTAKVVVAKALTQPLNPYRDLFPPTSNTFLSRCNEVRAHRYTFPDPPVTKKSSR